MHAVWFEWTVNMIHSAYIYIFKTIIEVRENLVNEIVCFYF